ncbi:MAG: hypothetical protein A2Y15_08465 [Clostridiales bacterium GWF2_36_10]|nr:MAG: hypothetical protein A2Y15_08465 [Clostridiales bacterium GWF2_36_10]HAN21802.1 hypothetical protein [Clostridiales bacterium]
MIVLNEKVIDFNKTIYELCSSDQSISRILAEIGFTDILKLGMINTVGRFMTIPKGASLKKLDLNMVIQAFKEQGYVVIT